MVLYGIGYLCTVGHPDRRVAVGLHEIAVTVEYAPEEIEHSRAARVEHMAAACVEQVSLHTVTLYEAAGARCRLKDGHRGAGGKQPPHGEAAYSGPYYSDSFHDHIEN